MREIKFRGVSMGGHFVYGFLTKKLIRNSGEICWAIATGLKQSQVIPVIEDSIAQLVGHDKNGREVYEGDIVIVEYESGDFCEHVARLESMEQNPDTAAFYFWAYPSSSVLKEKSA